MFLVGRDSDSIVTRLAGDRDGARAPLIRAGDSLQHGDVGPMIRRRRSFFYKTHRRPVTVFASCDHASAKGLCYT